jgi:diaminopimelate epimerase
MTQPALEFVKMHGLGNDFVLVDGIKQDLTGLDFAQLAPQICDRNFGIGADGILVVLSSQKADFRMRVFNPDGSEPEMCGNGIRCFAKYVYESQETKKEIISVETLAGIIIPEVLVHPADGGVQDGQVVAVEVDMGEPKLKACEIPISKSKIQNGDMELVNYHLEVADHKLYITCVSMGNPHCVIFSDNLDTIDLSKIGPAIENHPMFPEHTNVEIVEVINEKEIKISVWERGVGKTLACGTGAAATVVASVLNGKTGRDVLVHLPGGNLEVEDKKNSY